MFLQSKITESMRKERNIAGNTGLSSSGGLLLSTWDLLQRTPSFLKIEFAKRGYFSLKFVQGNYCNIS